MQLRESEERLRLASEAAGFGTYDYKLPPARSIGRRSCAASSAWKARQPLTLERVARASSTRTTATWSHGTCRATARTADRRKIEFRIVRPDGERALAAGQGPSHAATARRRSGWRVIGTVLDITERKQAEERQRLLMAELDHRVKNTLSNVSAVAHLSSHRAASVGSFVQALDGRIQAMSQAHALLARGAWAGAICASS